MADGQGFNNNFGPLPPVRAPSRRKWAKQMVWPRDKKQNGAHSWRRWKDIFTLKGPDMWISKSGEGPDRPLWTGWKTHGDGVPRWDNLGYHFNDNEIAGRKRPKSQRYDFNTRKYRLPHGNTWSDVKWDAKGRTPLYLRFQNLNYPVWVNPQVDGGMHGNGLGPNPFKWSPHTDYWDWHFDKYNQLEF